MANLQRSLYESKRRFDVGMITRADLAQVLAQVAQGQADITQAQSNNRKRSTVLSSDRYNA